MEAIIWLIILAILVVIEILTLGLTTIWFAGGALVAFLAAYFDVSVMMQIILFLVVSVVLFVFTRPVLMRTMNKTKEKTNIDSLMGKKAVVTKDINNMKAQGQVVVNGIEWTARSAQEGIIIPEKTIVCIKAVNGVKLLVEAIEKKEA